MKNRQNASVKIASSVSKKHTSTEKKVSARENQRVRKGKNNVSSSKCRSDCLICICWIIVPIVIIALVLLDAFSIYCFNEERLIVLGIGLLMLLFPFINEIKLNQISFKRNDKDHKDSQ